MKKKLVVAVVLGFLVLMGVLAFRGNSVGGSGIGLKEGKVIGVINIDGTIAGSSNASLVGSEICSAPEIMEAIRAAARRPDVKALVLRINSPGGTSGASQEIALELDRLRGSGKPIVTSMSDVCASGGYWVACSTDQIVANGATLTGSIGVIMEMNNIEGLYKKLGIRNEVIKSGIYKDIGSPTRPLTDNEREMLQGMVSDTYQQFVEQVKQGRKGKIGEEKLLEIADGRIFTGRQALQLGLVDSLGNYYDAITVAQNMAGLKGQPTIEVLNQGNIWSKLMPNLKPESVFKNQGIVDMKY